MIIDVAATINKPAEEVFPIVTNMSYFLKQVDPDVESIEKLTDGPVEIGTIWRETLKVPGSKLVIDLEATRIEPGRLLEIDIRTRFDHSVGILTC